METKRSEKKNYFIDKIKEDKMYLVPLCVYVFLFFFFCSKMSPLYPSNEWADPNIYFNVGKAMMNGKTLYSEVFDHKGPLIFIIYGIGYLISNTTFFGVFLISVISWIVALYSIFLLGRKILKAHDIFAFILAILVPPFVLTHLYYGGAAEEFVLCCMFVSLFLFVNYFTNNKIEQHDPKHMLIHGITTSITFFIKLNLTIFYIFPLVAILISMIYSKDIRSLIKNIAYYIIGVAIIALPIFLYFLTNGVVADAYYAYIELNKEIASDISPSIAFNQGVKIIYSLIKTYPIEVLLILIGGIYFPIKFSKNILGKVAIPISLIGLCAVIFFSNSYHFYYPLPLYVFLPLGLVSILHIASMFFSVIENKRIFVFLISFVLICAITKAGFFGVGIRGIARIEKQTGVGYQFSEKIKEEPRATLLNLAHGDANNIYTRCNIVPNVKFFFAPNIPHDKFPIMRDEQTQYIVNKEVMFIIINSWTADLDYFENLPAFKTNYELIDTYEGQDEFQPGKFGKDFRLYKLKK